MIVTDAELHLDRRKLQNWRFEQSFLDRVHPVAVALGPPSDACESSRCIFSASALQMPPLPFYSAPRPFSILNPSELLCTS